MVNALGVSQQVATRLQDFESQITAQLSNLQTDFAPWDKQTKSLWVFFFFQGEKSTLLSRLLFLFSLYFCQLGDFFLATYQVSKGTGKLHWSSLKLTANKFAPENLGQNKGPQKERIGIVSKKHPFFRGDELNRSVTKLYSLLTTSWFWSTP